MLKSVSPRPKNGWRNFRVTDFAFIRSIDLKPKTTIYVLHGSDLPIGDDARIYGFDWTCAAGFCPRRPAEVEFCDTNILD